MRNIRILILMIVLTLMAIGIVMIYSSTAIYAWERFNDSTYFLKRHVFFILVGSVLTVSVMYIDYRVLRGQAKTLVLLAVFMLAFLLVPGISREIAGAKRWFKIMGFSFQPSEFANLAMIIYVASFLSRKAGTKQMESFKTGVLPVLIVLGIVGLLILIQPDLGTVLSLCMIVFLMLYVAGAKLKYLFYTGLSALPFLYLLIIRVPYRRGRIMSFLNPWADPLGAGFQLIQARIALGSGGLLGRGLGKSLQKLFYLPAAHTDFIFSIIGEELGFFATLFVVVLFILLLIQGARVVRHTKNSFGKFLSLGIIISLIIKAIINIGVNTGIFPTKGLPLPFISYGGSSMVFDMISIGLLLNVARFGEEP